MTKCSYYSNNPQSKKTEDKSPIRTHCTAQKEKLAVGNGDKVTEVILRIFILGKLRQINNFNNSLKENITKAMSVFYLWMFWQGRSLDGRYRARSVVDKSSTHAVGFCLHPDLGTLNNDGWNKVSCSRVSLLFEKEFNPRLWQMFRSIHAAHLQRNGAFLPNGIIYAQVGVVTDKQSCDMGLHLASYFS